MALMAIWWATEALPFAATALVPICLLPPLGAARRRIAHGYGNTTLYLILGGFLLGLAMERCNLHRRIAYAIVARAGGNPEGLVLGMMCATGFVSMWVQNTSTTLMMLPVAVSVATIVAPPDAAAADRNAANFGKAIVLCVAYAATIGGLGTIVGTATNALVVGFMQQNYGETISFTQWLAFGIPTVLLLMPLAWLVLVKLAFPFRLGSQATARDALIAARTALGPMSKAERRVTVVFVTTAIAWIAGPLIRQLPDSRNSTIRRSRCLLDLPCS
jgi:sodium-dependent dicarboxylate transporter 2/3/5